MNVRGTIYGRFVNIWHLSFGLFLLRFPRLAVHLRQASLAAHHSGHFLNALHRERRVRQRPHSDGHELHGVIVRQHPVGAELAAALAPVDDGPLPFIAHPHRHRLHNAAAVGLPIPGLNVHMERTQTVGAVIPMVAAGAHRNHQSAAVFAGEAFLAGVGLIVALFVLSALIFTVHSWILPFLLFP